MRQCQVMNAVANLFYPANMYDLILKNQFDVNSNKLLSNDRHDVKVDYMFMSPVKVNENGMFIDGETQSVGTKELK